MKFGIAIFNGNRPTIKRFTKATSLESFARIFLKSKLHEESLKNNIDGLTEYLNGWLEWSEETEDPCTEFSQIIDTAADTLTYSNVHLQKFVGGVWIPLSSEDKKIFAQTIVERLESVPEKV